MKNIKDFNKENIEVHTKNWNDFDFENAEEILLIQKSTVANTVYKLIAV